MPRALPLAFALLCVAATAPAATRHTVALSNFAFTPTSLTISVGDTVRWQNPATAQTHTVTNGTGQADPAAGTLFDATVSGANAWFQYVFSAPGTVPVFCRPHESLVMKMTIVVQVPNDPPLIAAIGPQSVNEGETLTVTPSASDANGDALSWVGGNLPAGASVDPATGVLTWTPEYTQAGTYPGVSLTADDGHGGSGSVSFTITVANVNRAPQVTAVPDQLAPEQELLVVAPGGSDPDGEPLAWEETGLPPGAQFDASDGSFVWTPGAADVGNVLPVTLTARDPGGLSAATSFTITVTLSPSTVLLERLGPPRGVAIAAVAPSPFRDRVECVVGTPAARRLAVSVWRVDGRRVVTLRDGAFAAGYTRLVWEARDVPAGQYLLRVEDGRSVRARRIVKLP